MFEINNSFLNINISDNNIKPASFQPAKILHDINAFFVHVYISQSILYIMYILNRIYTKRRFSKLARA